MSTRLAELDQLPAPDLWDDIVARTRAPRAVDLDGDARVPRRRTLTRRVVAVAAAGVLFATGVLLGRSGDEGGRVEVSETPAAPVTWGQAAVFEARPAVAGAAWLVARDERVAIGAYALDGVVRVFDVDDPVAPPRTVAVPTVAALGVYGGAPVVLGDDGQLVVASGRTRVVARLAPVGSTADLTVASGKAWIARPGDQPLTVVDLETGVVRDLETVRGVDVVRAGNGHVWAASSAQHRLMALADDGRVLAERQLDGVVEIQPGAAGDAWILRSSSSGGEVVHIDARLATVTTVPVRSTASAFAADDGGLWTLDRGRLTRTAFGSAEPEQIFSVGATVGRLVSLGDALYVFGAEVRVFRPTGTS